MTRWRFTETPYNLALCENETRDPSIDMSSRCGARLRA
jgi:hypothetical protein